MSATYGGCNPQFVKFSFTGNNGAGNISVPGVVAGDAIVWFSGNWNTGAFIGAATIDTNDVVEQLTSSDLSAQTISIIVSRWS